MFFKAVVVSVLILICWRSLFLFGRLGLLVVLMVLLLCTDWIILVVTGFGIGLLDCKMLFVGIAGVIGDTRFAPPGMVGFVSV